MRWLAGIVLLVLAGAAAYWVIGRGGPPVAAFAKAGRERLVSTLNTNGRIEPSEWAVIRAPRAGRLVSLTVSKGQALRAGQVVGHLESDAARAGVVAAEAGLERAKSELAALVRGAAPAVAAEIDGALETARVEHENAQRRLKNLEALVATQAATKRELEQARDRARLAASEISALERRRAALKPDAPSVTAAQARIRDAEAALNLARQAVTESALASPLSGTLYSLEVRAGAVLANGAPIGEVGKLDQLRAIVYVDEPELGRVSTGLPVELTWDALPGRTWSAKVERMPAQVVALGSRQVGEVVCRLESGGQALPVGANVNAAIVSQTVENALAIPKEALRREDGQSVVYVLEAGRLARRAVRTGVSSITRVEVLQGLKEGELVALPTEVPLLPGAEVTPEVQ